MTGISVSAITSADKIISFSDRKNRTNSHKLKFSLKNSISASDDVLESQLRIYRDLRRCEHPSNGTYTVTVYRVSKKDGIKLYKLDSKKVSSQHNGWVLFNATRGVSVWTEDPSQNHGVIIRVTATSQKVELDPREIGLLTSGTSVRKLRPFLLVFARSNSQHVMHHERKKYRRSSSSLSASSSSSSVSKKRRTRRQQHVSYWDDGDSWTPSSECSSSSSENITYSF